MFIGTKLIKETRRPQELIWHAGVFWGWLGKVLVLGENSPITES